MHVNWAVTIEESYYNIELYAKDTGKATFENKYDFLKNPNSPSLTVGFKPSKNFKKKKIL